MQVRDPHSSVGVPHGCGGLWGSACGGPPQAIWSLSATGGLSSRLSSRLSCRLSAPRSDGAFGPRRAPSRAVHDKRQATRAQGRAARATAARCSSHSRTPVTRDGAVTPKPLGKSGCDGRGTPGRTPASQHRHTAHQANAGAQGEEQKGPPSAGDFGRPRRELPELFGARSKAAGRAAADPHSHPHTDPHSPHTVTHTRCVRHTAACRSLTCMCGACDAHSPPSEKAREPERSGLPGSLRAVWPHTDTHGYRLLATANLPLASRTGRHHPHRPSQQDIGH